jgi:hypothetical protein
MSSRLWYLPKTPLPEGEVHTIQPPQVPCAGTPKDPPNGPVSPSTTEPPTPPSQNRHVKPPAIDGAAASPKAEAGEISSERSGRAAPRSDDPCARSRWTARTGSLSSTPNQSIERFSRRLSRR